VTSASGNSADELAMDVLAFCGRWDQHPHLPIAEEEILVHLERFAVLELEGHHLRRAERSVTSRVSDRDKANPLLGPYDASNQESL